MFRSSIPSRKMHQKQNLPRSNAMPSAVPTSSETPPRGPHGLVCSHAARTSKPTTTTAASVVRTVSALVHGRGPEGADGAWGAAARAVRPTAGGALT